MLYTLYNKSNDKTLTHPYYGIWTTSNLIEARNMLESCHEYLEAVNIPNTEFNNFVLWDIESNKEVIDE